MFYLRLSRTTKLVLGTVGTRRQMRLYSKIDFKPSKKEVEGLKRRNKWGRDPGPEAVGRYKQIPPLIILSRTAGV